jgi:predicted permease
MVQMWLSLGVKLEGTSTSIPELDCETVSRDYFRVLGMRVIEGRGFNADDRNSPRPVYVINKTLARQLSPDGSPIGKTISVGPSMAPGEIVGIVNDMRRRRLEAPPKPTLFVDPEHTIGIIGVAEGGVYFTVRTVKDAAEIVPEIRGIVRDLDPNLVVDNIATMNQIISNSITTPRSYALLLGTFSASALALAMIGLYGVLSYFVMQRTREIGIRVALGAQTLEVIVLVLREGLALSITGVVLGVAVGLTLTRYLEKMLFGVAALDVTTFAGVSALFILVTLIASYFPARHAAKIDPLVALHYE